MTDDVLEKFVRWRIDCGDSKCNVMMLDKNTFIESLQQVRYIAWQAARAQPIVLQESVGNRVVWVNDIISQLQAQGFTVESE
jgi:hypothetical protein